jgi:hypothetical protein
MKMLMLIIIIIIIIIIMEASSVKCLLTRRPDFDYQQGQGSFSPSPDYHVQAVSAALKLLMELVPGAFSP